MITKSNMAANLSNQVKTHVPKLITFFIIVIFY